MATTPLPAGVTTGDRGEHSITTTPTHWWADHSPATFTVYVTQYGELAVEVSGGACDGTPVEPVIATLGPGDRERLCALLAHVDMHGTSSGKVGEGKARMFNTDLIDAAVAWGREHGWAIDDCLSDLAAAEDAVMECGPPPADDLDAYYVWVLWLAADKVRAEEGDEGAAEIVKAP